MASYLAARTAGGRTAAWLPVLKSYGALVCLLLLTAALGQLGLGGVARPLFVAGCLVVATLAWRAGGLGQHVEVCIALFVFAPLLRRVVDLHAGFEPSGFMLVGPLLALMAAFPELRGLLSRRRHGGFEHSGALLAPYWLMAGCVAYGWVISAFQNDMLGATIAAAKYLVPMLYSVCLILRPDQSGTVLRAAARAFLVVSPVIGLYGIAQNLAPPAWDTYWMVSSKMLSIGAPEAGQIRVFSTMNSPASFAFYAVCGLLLFSFTRSVVPPVVVAVGALLPLAVALLLSGVRTAWISAAVAVTFCLLFRPTRARAGILAVCLALGVAFTLLYTSFGDVVASRLDTLGGGVAQDGSGQDRLHDYLYVFNDSSRYLFGIGLSGDSDPQMAALDGQLLLSVVQMGLVAGMLHMLAILWAGAQALLSLRHDQAVLRIVAGAVVIGDLSVFLLLGFSVGEIGFLFWMLVGVLTPHQAVSRSR